MSDFQTHMLRVEDALADYAQAKREFDEWLIDWRKRRVWERIDPETGEIFIGRGRAILANKGAA